jgi:hypothetical protein
MLTISNNGIITVNRGDDFSVPLFINQGTELAPARYTLTGTDEVYLGIFSDGANYLLDTQGTIIFVQNSITYLGIPEINIYFDNAVVRKTLTTANLNANGDVLIKFTNNDTKFLLPGNYYYQIRAKITKDSQLYINTIVSKTPFIVLA